MSDHAQNLRQAAEEIRREGHAGWGNACEWAANEIERLRADLRDMRDRAEAAEENAMPDDLTRELDRLRHENGDRGNQIINLRRELADMSVISGIDDRYAGRLAFMLECLIVDYHGHWDAACALLDEYKAEWDRVNPSPPTFMGEPMPEDRRERLEELRNDRAEIAQKSRALPEFTERGR